MNNMKISKFYLAGIASLMLCACTGNDEPGNGDIKIPQLDAIELSAVENNANVALNEFSYRFFKKAVCLEIEKKLEFEDGNVSVSPVSAAMALSMFANTIDNDSQKDFLERLGYNDLDILNNTCKKILSYLPSKINGCQLYMANSVWHQYDLTSSKEWKNCLATNFYAPVYSIDLHIQEGIDKINAWCDRNTNGMIPAILDEVDEESIFYLLNAFYFNGEWSHKFDKEKTSSGTFYGRDKQSDTDMMHQTLYANYFQGSNYEAIVLPFKGNTRMLLIAPGNNTDISGIIESLSYQDLKDIAIRSEGANVNLTLPKFEIQNTTGLDKILEEMDINMSFFGDKVGYCDYIEAKAKQKTTVSIDEEGAKMAAVTVIHGGTALWYMPKDVTLTLDHPFIYLVENTKTGSILMAGVINNL